MKKSIMSVAFFGACLFFNQIQAQPRVSVNIQLGMQPAWLPGGYSNVDYYYFPDIQAYYYTAQRQFIYQEGGRWVFAASLPDRCRSYDLYRGYKVVANGPRPYLRNDIYRDRYGRNNNYYDRQPEHRDYRDRHDDYNRNGHEHDQGRGREHNQGRGRSY